MSVVKNLQRQFAYEFWANSEEAKVLAQLSPPPAAAVRARAHIIGAGWVWADRLQKHPQRLAVWPEISLAECDAQLQELEAAWRAILGSLTESGLQDTCSYKNSKGEAWESNIQDILTHVLLHSAYHRGQIAFELRRLGSTPAYTDYIHAVRQGLLE